MTVRTAQVSMAQVTSLVAQYISCWQKGGFFRLANGAPAPPSVQRVVQDNDFGWEVYQLGRSGLFPHDVAHADLPQFFEQVARVAVHAQLNRDHKLLWSWAADIAKNGLRESNWRDATEAFANLVHLMLLRSPRLPAGTEGFHARQNVNKHLLGVASNHHEISAPLAFALLEGVLRRKAASHVQLDGRPKQTFTISYIDQSGNPQKRTFDPSDPRARVNRIHQLFLLLETLNGGHLPAITAAVEKEIRPWFTSGVYSEIDGYRNEMLHGNSYWTGLNGALLLLISALTLDEISPADYQTARSRLASRGMYDFDSLYPPEEPEDVNQ